ncbi:prepilin peptidase [Rhizobium sp. SSA_523]|uniref:A24 family peptidase n=1 Tax=Rhizobium sp. SSA_523 TaxID=2952477 RepID=UPI002090B7FB|nr:prepilin peptidase [Rhizobium sp. SSA_523]MCO5732783.1 prepilin peptidase [Rhizobium sp. SSA_523]WKC23599.1 prepilin peptidase [Rhizobium sp. SSA_523]
MLSLFSALLPAALAVAAATDLLTMKIPNGIPLALILCFFPVAALAGMAPMQIVMAVAAALAVFSACFALFATGVMGGGDAKLLTATALWFGLNSSLVEYLVLVAFAGGLLTLIILVLRWRADMILAIGLRLPHSLVGAKKVPYALAIAAGGILSWSHSPLFTLLMQPAL